jgi:hypothetical protein
MGITIMSEMSYDSRMAPLKNVSIKLAETTLRRLRQEARTTGRTVAALIRERIEDPVAPGGRSVYDLTSDLAGSLAGSQLAATNQRRRFRRA